MTGIGIEPYFHPTNVPFQVKYWLRFVGLGIWDTYERIGMKSVQDPLLYVVESLAGLWSYGAEQIYRCATAATDCQVKVRVKLRNLGNLDFDLDSNWGSGSRCLEP